MLNQWPLLFSKQQLPHPNSRVQGQRFLTLKFKKTRFSSKKMTLYSYSLTITKANWRNFRNSPPKTPQFNNLDIRLNTESFRVEESSR
uniref:SM10-1 n=1 Tax=Solanum tuberosum TaxID=4113 RepID=M1BZZ8_SOLTU